MAQSSKRSGWYPQTQEEHALDMRDPQKFKLTGDGLVTHRIIKDGPFNGPDIGAELALARYRDWEHQHGRMEKQMPQSELDTKLEAYLQSLLNRAPQAQETQALTEKLTVAQVAEETGLSPRRADGTIQPWAKELQRTQTLEQPKEEQRRERSLSI